MSIMTPRPDASPVVVRRLRDDDLAQVEGLCRRQTPRHHLLRFFTTTPRLGPATLAELTDQHNGDRVALVAVLGDRLVGLARYDRVEGAERADAFVLVDEHIVAPGLDMSLLADLLCEARSAGIRRVALEVHPLDRERLATLDDSPYRTASHLHCGIVTVTIDVPA